MNGRAGTDSATHDLQDARRVAAEDLADLGHRLSHALSNDNTITINDNRTMKRYKSVNDGVDAPYLEEELQVRYDVTFSRVPVNERCVFCNAVYLGAAKVRHNKGGYVLEYHVWLVDFLRAANVNYGRPVKGLLLVEAKRWRNAALPECRAAFKGLCAARADRRREIVAIETDLEARI